MQRQGGQDDIGDEQKEHEGFSWKAELFLDLAVHGDADVQTKEKAKTEQEENDAEKKPDDEHGPTSCRPSPS